MIVLSPVAKGGGSMVRADHFVCGFAALRRDISLSCNERA